MKEDENEGEGDEINSVADNANFVNNKNNLLEKVKKELLHRGQYQEVDQKCQSFKSFINLMDSNALFKELRSDPNKVNSDANKPLFGHSIVSRGLTNQSQYMSSMHLSELNEESRTRNAATIADDFIAALEADFGIKSTKISINSEAPSTRNKSKSDARQEPVKTILNARTSLPVEEVTAAGATASNAENGGNLKVRTTDRSAESGANFEN